MTKTSNSWRVTDRQGHVKEYKTYGMAWRSFRPGCLLEVRKSTGWERVRGRKIGESMGLSENLIVLGANRG